MFNFLSDLMSKTNRWHRIIFVFVVLHSGVIPGNRLGFHCNDPKLSHPFTGDTITWKVLFLTTGFLPLLVMLIFERLYHKELSTGGAERKNYFLKWYKEYFYGLLINMIVVNILKTAVGEPRPHFFDTCKPQEALSCIESEYVPIYTCAQPSWFSESARSFPSGHSALGVHCCLFIFWYLQVRIGRTVSAGSRRASPWQMLCVGLALWCGASRVGDRRHHWWDVLAGALVAAPVLYYTVIYLCKNFECSNNGAKKKEILSETLASSNVTTNGVAL